MNIRAVTDTSFQPYGNVITGYDFAPLLERLNEISPMPTDSVIYVAGDAKLETLPVAQLLQNAAYGGMPIQVGYCNGSNHKLNCLEYHRDSEIDIAADDVILLLAKQQDIQNGSIDTSKVEAFLLPRGSAVELYATTLHYAPCNAPDSDGFRVIIVLPKGTNTDKPNIEVKNHEDALLWACNKWLLAHADAPEAREGAHIGLTGANIVL